MLTKEQKEKIMLTKRQPRECISEDRSYSLIAIAIVKQWQKDKAKGNAEPVDKSWLEGMADLGTRFVKMDLGRI